MLIEYRKHLEERARQGIPPLPLTAAQVHSLCDLVVAPPAGEEAFLIDLLAQRVPPGVDPAAEVKAAFLNDIAQGSKSSPIISKEQAVHLLGTMMGGFNVKPLVALLSHPSLATHAVAALEKVLLVFDSFNDVTSLAEQQNPHAKALLQAWANATWFTSRPELPEEIKVIVFKVSGEINTDDFSPASQAFSRPDIPLHALCMGETRFPGGIARISELAQGGRQVAFVGDVVGTGSSRKSACNSVLWHIGQDIAFVPNKRRGGVILGGQIAPIFFNTAEDSGSLPIRCDVAKLETGMQLSIFPRKGEIHDSQGKVVSSFTLDPPTLADEVRAGGRVPLIIGRALTARARKYLGLPEITLFARSKSPPDTGKGYTLAQKMVGRACGLAGVRPGTSCEPAMTTVGSQDTTGPMTADELTELSCLRFQADLVMQSFCHTAAYPKAVDVKMHGSLSSFVEERGGVALRPGDGIIHSWLNRLLLPDTVGTGGDSHTRFPIGISFPAGSGLVAFAAALGVMPLDMPESVLVRFKGNLQPGVTLRDLVNAIPYVAIKQGLLTVAKKGKKNVFNGRILEMEGLPDLKVEQAFELSDAAAERSAAAATVRLNKEPVIEYLRSNLTLMKWLIAQGYGDAQTLRRRAQRVEEFLANPVLLEPDADAEYAAVIEIDMNEIKEPIVACPNDPDDVKLLSEVAGDKVDEVFIGSCMTNIGHYRAAARLLEGTSRAGATLWIAPPTRMDADQLRKEGVYSTFGKVGARMEIPGCSLCMGNQARVKDGVTVFSTSTRNFDNRMGNGARVYLGSSELAAIVALGGRIPTVGEYREAFGKLAKVSADVYRYLNFDQLEEYVRPRGSLRVID
jgi:aconitate hydratase 2/2-methylisocitrate dehydratase